MGFVAAVLLVLAACTSQRQVGGLHSAEPGLLCYDSDGFAVRCAAIERTTKPTP